MTGLDARTVEAVSEEVLNLSDVLLFTHDLKDLMIEITVSTIMAEEPKVTMTAIAVKRS